MTSLGHAIDALRLQPSDQKWVLSVLAEIPPTYGHRAAIGESTRRTLEQLAPSRLPELDAYAAMWPSYPRFSMRSAREIFLIGCCGAVLVYPDAPLREAFLRFTRHAITGMSESPVLRPLFVACDGDPARYLQATARANRLIDNFGERSLEQLGRNHWQLELRGWPPQYAELVLRPYLEGLLEIFELHGEVGFEHLPDEDDLVYVDVRWS